MKRSLLAFGVVALSSVFSVHAQEATTPADGAAPATDAPSTDAPQTTDTSGSADTSTSTDGTIGSSDSTPSADSGSAATDSSATSSGDSSSSSDSSTAATSLGDTGDSAAAETPADTKPGFPLYVGVERDAVRVELNQNSLRDKFGGDRRYDSDFYKLRLGVRIFEGVGLELQGGAGGSNSGSGEVKVKDFAGLYIVPTAVALGAVEISARLGYSYMDVKNDDAKKGFDGVSYGVGIELPFRTFGDGLPNFRLTLAGIVYSQESDYRIFGWSGGLRYDFNM